MNDATGCPSEDSLLAFVHGAASDAEAAGIRTHLEACAACSAIVGEAARGSSDESQVKALGAGSKIGRYSILELVGRGSNGLVYSAYDPELDRRVGIKLLRVETASALSRGELQARLLREAQAMARLEHPHVLSVYEIGPFGDGIFLAMPFVSGGTLRRWLSASPRSWRSIVEVFLQAGEGLAAAHRAGIVHRDFKPENVLIDASGRVFVTDFGLARLSGEQTKPETPTPSPQDAQLSLTSPGAMLGTPLYMAPEQLAGEHVDARADVFSFCASLYQALYGAHPFDATNLEELKAAVNAGRVREPPRSPVPARVRRAILRGLRTNPAERFPSMQPLLHELKIDTRRRTLGLASATGLLLLVVVAGLWWKHAGDQRLVACARGDGKGERVWSAERQESVRAAFTKTPLAYAGASFERVKTALDSWVAQWATARTEACAATLVRGEQSAELLDRRLSCLDDRMQDASALVDAFAQADGPTVEKATSAVGQLDGVPACADRRQLLEAMPMPERLRKQIESVRGEVATLSALDRAGKYRDGADKSSKVLEEAQALAWPPLEAEALYWRGKLLEDASDPKAAEPVLRNASATALRARRDDLSAQAMTQLVLILGTAQRLGEALGLAEQARALLAREGDDPVLVGELSRAIGIADLASYKSADALPQLQQAVALMEKALGPANDQVLTARFSLAQCYQFLDRLPESLKADDEALQTAIRVQGERHPNTAAILAHSALVLGSMGLNEEALARELKALAIRREVLGPSAAVARSLGLIGSTYTAMGRFDEANPAYRESIEISSRIFGADHPLSISNRALSVAPLMYAGRFPEAHEALEQAKSAARGLPPESAIHAFMREMEADLLASEHHIQEAAVVYAEARALLDKASPGEPDAGHCLSGVGAALLEKGQVAKALETQKQAVALVEKASAFQGPDLLDPLRALGEAQLAAGQDSEARTTLTRALGLQDATRGRDPWSLAEVNFTAAKAFWTSAADRPKALQLIAEVQGTVKTARYPRGDLRANLEDWLKTHRGEQDLSSHR